MVLRGLGDAEMKDYSTPNLIRNGIILSMSFFFPWSELHKAFPRPGPVLWISLRFPKVKADTG